MNHDSWRGKSYAFFSNKNCECFPCHNTEDIDGFNCLFCYCPLYTLGSECGGSPFYTENGIKNCSNCGFPHDKENYGLIMERLQVVVNSVKKGGLV